MDKVSQVAGASRPGVTRASQHTIGGLAIAGGAVVAAGTAFAWFSLFAGLQPYRGIDLLNGRLLLAGGLLSILAGAWFLFRRRLWLHWGIGLLGFALLALGSWSLLQLLVIYRRLAGDPFMVAALGPGLFLAVAGALLIFATLFLSA